MAKSRTKQVGSECTLSKPLSCPNNGETLRRLERLLNKHDLKFTDYTDVYVNRKFNKLDYVDWSVLRGMIKLSKLLKTEKIMKKFALKVSVLLYLCQIK